MPIVDGKYVSPMWVDNAPPSLNAEELNDLGKTIEKVEAYEQRQIGDILLTNRTDLGNQYLLCNGETINQSMYPALYEKLQPRGINGDFKRYWPDNTGMPIGGGVSYANGIYFLILSLDGSKYTIKYSADKINWNSGIIEKYGHEISARSVSTVLYKNENYYFASSERTTNLDSGEILVLYSFSLDGTFKKTGVSTMSKKYGGRNIDLIKSNICNNKMCFWWSVYDDVAGEFIMNLILQSDDTVPIPKFLSSYCSAGQNRDSVDNLSIPQYDELHSIYFFAGSYNTYYTSTGASLLSIVNKKFAHNLAYYNGKLYLVYDGTHSSSVFAIDEITGSNKDLNITIPTAQLCCIITVKDRLCIVCYDNGKKFLGSIIFEIIESVDGISYKEYETRNVNISFSRTNITTNDGVIIISDISGMYVLNTSEKVLPSIDGFGMFPMIKALDK